MKRPDLDAALAPLKGFQRKSVDHAFDRLFLAPDSTGRFLVADEVGLGKTLVARGVIARTLDHLWDEVERIDIVYICSNASIARQNLEKLRVSGQGERSFALATRLTMLASQLAPRDGRQSLRDSKVNFVSFTPGTSFEMGHSTGRWKERAVLFELLTPHVESRRSLENLLQGNISDHDWWRNQLQTKPQPIEDSIRVRFDERLLQDPALIEQLSSLLNTSFRRTRKQWPREVRKQRNTLIAQFRTLLASVCVAALEPDLVILDEFQRFKSLLETREEERNPAAELAQALFDATTPEGNPVRTLLLSATPYKLYTTDAEIEHEDHYEDFLATTRFLMGGDEVRVERLQHQLSTFGGALKRAASGGTADVGSARKAVEQTLRGVMARTERVSASEDQDAMIEEPRVDIQINAGDVRQYLAADALFTAVGDRDPMSFWKSAPYLAHFMHGYRFNARLDDTVQSSPDLVSKVLSQHGTAFLKAETLQRNGELDPANAKLRELLSDVRDGLWKLLWMPPTVPYWPLEGPYAGQESRTKSLLFSAWNVVPDVVSAVVSYEVERLMAGERLDSYAEPAKQQGPLLRLTQTAGGKRSGHRALLVVLPCLPLADLAHPLLAPAGADRRAWVRTQVAELLAKLPNPTVGEVDGRWEWALPLLIDPGLRPFLAEWKKDAARGRPNPELFGSYVDDLLELDPAELGPRPPDLLDLATELALGAPGVVCARTIGMAGLDDADRRRLSVQIALEFWSLFNRPTVITLLRNLQDEESPYWRTVLHYCQAGNLQAVLDEAWHMVWEQHDWSAESSRLVVAEHSAEQVAAFVTPPTSRVHAHFLKTQANGEIERDVVRVRTDLALRLGEAKGEVGEEQTSQDGVRAAFNSPFRPFVLASTSIGQEGLDFHPWCHRLVHWNLPGNPVDLEQREGRVHRYKGHAVRRNVADGYAALALASWSSGDDLWALMFQAADRAARERGDSDLVPYWLAPGKWRVQRHVPLLPWTREVEAFARLKKQLAAYRVVFGQPRQEELLSLLERAEIDADALNEWVIDLRPD